MPSPHHHPNCPRCKGEGFYLRRSGHGFYRDGSFGHNDWQDCDCYPHMKPERLPAAVDPDARERERINRTVLHRAIGG